MLPSEQNTNQDFFSCRSEDDFAYLERFLQQRQYNLADFEVMSRDKNGCPLIKLGYRKLPDQPIQKRGLIWFPNEALVRIAKYMIEKYLHLPSRNISNQVHDEITNNKPIGEL